MADRHTERDSALLPIGETARTLGVSVDTVRRWESEGKLQSTRTLGNQRRFRRADIEALLGERVA